MYAFVNCKSLFSFSILFLQYLAMTLSKLYYTRENRTAQPFIIFFFQGVIALKRMIHRKRKWKLLNKPKSSIARPAILIEIQKSQHNVKCASFGRAIMNVTGEVLQEYQREEAQRRAETKMKRENIAQLVATRRGGMKLDYSCVAAMEKKTIQLDAPKLSVADKIRSLKSNSRIEEGRPSTAPAGNRRQSIRENATKDLTTIVLKNAHIAKTNEKNAMGAAHGSSDVMRHSLRNMKKMDVQDVMNYAPGTAVYFGATIALQVA